jgi:tRNA(fMet)-specific endonuclease VapC
MIAEPLSLIDTDILSYVLKRKEPVYQNSIKYLKKFSRFKISCITYYECLRGYKAVGATKRLEVFQKLLQITDVIYLDKPILDKAGEIYGVLKTKGLLKGEFDLLIGTTAIVNQMKIVTNNEKHYQPLKDYFNLEVKNWMKE